MSQIMQHGNTDTEYQLNPPFLSSHFISSVTGKGTDSIFNTQSCTLRTTTTSSTTVTTNAISTPSGILDFPCTSKILLTEPTCSEPHFLKECCDQQPISKNKICNPENAPKAKATEEAPSRSSGTLYPKSNVTLGSISNPVSIKPPGTLSTASLHQVQRSLEKHNQMARSVPRTSSTDSTDSSVSAENQAGFVQEIATSPEIQNLIAAAGSAEAVISYLLKEKKSQAAQNSQLWRLVDKQRAMILGLNKDLERTLKEKERYRRKVKETVAIMSTPLDSSLPDNSSEPQISATEQPAPPNSGNIASVINPELGEQREHPELDMTKELNLDDSGRQALPLPELLAEQPTNSATVNNTHDLKHQPTQDSSIKSEVSNPPSTPNLIWRRSPSLKIKVPSLKRSKESLKDKKELRRFTLPSHNVPSVLLNMKKFDLPNPEALVTPTLRAYARSDEDVISTQRGRRKTREEDERDRTILTRGSSETRNPCITASTLILLPAKSTELKSPYHRTTISPSTPASKPTLLSLNDTRNTIETKNSDYHSPALSPRTPGLPSSPRPLRNDLKTPPIRSPDPSSTNSASTSSSPWSHKSSILLDVDPFSHEDLGIESVSKLNILSPLPSASSANSLLESHLQGLPLKSPKPLVINKILLKNNSEKENDVTQLPDSASPLQDGIYRGLVSDEFPDLLLPPNALPLIDVKVASSRLKSSRASMMFPKNSEDEPVFTLALFARSNKRELWRVEKDLSSLILLDNNLKQTTPITVKVPEKSLFSGCAPAKLDARRSALNNYMEKILESQLTITSALEICRYLSSNALEAYAEDIAPKLRNEKFQGSLPDSKDTTRPIKSGYLTKRGKNFGGWKSRYFELGGPVLKYYESPGGPHLGAIKLQQAQIGKQSQPTDKTSQTGGNGDGSDRQYRHAFLILEPKRKDSSTLVRHVLCAESDIERDQWVDALCQYINYKDPEKKPSISTPPAEQSNSNSSRNSNEPKVKKKAQPQKKQVQQDLSEESLRGVSYEDTKVGQRPLLGQKNSSTSASSSKSGNDRDTPTPTLNPISAAQAQPSKAIPTSKSVQTMQDFTARVNQQINATSAIDEKIKQKKKSFFGFGTKTAKVTMDMTEPSIAENNTNMSEKIYEQSEPVRSTFGAPLAVAVRYNRSSDAKVVLPAVVYRCIEYLNEENASNEEGIFRLSGSNVVIRQLRERFNIEGDVDLVNDDQYYDVHAVASLLKLYLRELPTTILTTEYHLDFLAVTDLPDINQKVDALNKLVKKLPKENRALLQYLASFLIKIINNSDVNKMTVRNVGIVFSPTLNIPASVFALLLQQYIGIFNEQPSHQSRQFDKSTPADIVTLNGAGYGYSQASPSRPSPSVLKTPRQIASMNGNIPLPAYYKTNVEPTRVNIQSNRVGSQPSSPAPVSGTFGKAKKRESSMFSMNMVSLSQRRTSMSLIDGQPV
ncbi:hypothetical protein K3495_g6668 [Podosphaera aphanis]|nr:hypothetical protein K3495_g6668 [Podosphaera aphanis]